MQQKNEIDTAILDNMIVGRVDPHIYAFTTNFIPNYLKVGYTGRPLGSRLSEWRHHFEDLENHFADVAKVDDETYFKDFAVHKFLEAERGKKHLQKDYNKKIPYYSIEFFKDTEVKDVEDAIKDIKESYSQKINKYKFYTADELGLHEQSDIIECDKTFEPRPNQQEAINNFNEAIKNGRTKLLMYAVMRFGKSFTSMCCATEMSAKVVVIVSAKGVEYEWRYTVKSHTRFKDYEFLGRNELKWDYSIIKKTLDEKKKVVVFLTLQDLNPNKDKKIKKKHEDLFNTKIDLLIIDETHFGARGEKYGQVLAENNLTGPEIENEKNEGELNDDTFDELNDRVKTLQAKIRLHLSGTPYYILMRNEFSPEEIIAQCQFSDIVEAQEAWDEENLNNEDVNEWDNPYYGFPQMVRFAFNPNASARKKLEELKKDGKLSFSALFRPKSIIKDEEHQTHKLFEHKKEILDLLKVIDGTKSDDELLGFLDYDKIKEGKMCRHIVCVLPFRASCDALEKLITDNKKEFKNLNQYEIINIAGVDNERFRDKPQTVAAKIEKCEKKNQKTITLTVNYMLTGSTVKEWDTMLYLKDTTSPQEYDQAIFRLQSQYIETLNDDNKKDILNNDNGKDIIKRNMKPQTLLVDFDPNRMYVMQERKSRIYNEFLKKTNTTKLEEHLENELFISPIITINKKKIVKVEPADIIDAVREYSKNKSIADEAAAIPVDSALKNITEIAEEINKQEKFGSKKGLKLKATTGEGDDLDTPEYEKETDTKKSTDIKDRTDIEKDMADFEEKFKTYYSRILFFAFLTDDKVTSLDNVIEQIENNKDNKRIAENLGLKEIEALRLIRDNIKYFTRWTLDDKIRNINTLASDDEKEPIERVSTALKKFGRLSSSEIVTPEKIADEMINLLPEINNTTKILDIASKQGEFVYAIYKNPKYGKQVAQNVYCIPTSGLTYELTLKVYKLLKLDVSHIESEHDSYYLIDKKTTMIKDNKIIINNQEMKFDIIVGNPPYDKVVAKKETANGQKVRISIFQHFQTISDKLGKYTSLIYPGGRWIHRSGKGFKKFGLAQINDPHLSLLIFYPDSTDVFQDVGIADGISIVMKDMGKKECGFKYVYSLNGKNISVNAENPKEELFPLNPLDKEISDCLINAISTYDCLHKFILPRSLFSIESDFVEKNPTLVRKYKEGDSYDPNTEIKLFTNDKAGKSGRARWYVANKNVITTGLEQLNKWKVIVSSANAGDQKRSNQIAIVDDHSAFGRSRVALKTFDTKKEAENFFKYATSEIIRFAFLLTDESLTSLAKKVPDLLDYTDNNGIIDYAKDVNAQLYDLFGIDKKNQLYIKEVLQQRQRKSTD